MATLKWSDLPEWATKTEKVLDAIVSQAAFDMMASVKIVPGITRGGSRVEGTIPRDLGALAASLQSSLNGSTAMSGEGSYAFVAGSMKAGDVAEFSWGGSAAPYARHIHYGAKGVAGTFWLDVAAAGWKSKWVPGALDKAKAGLR